MSNPSQASATSPTRPVKRRTRGQLRPLTRAEKRKRQLRRLENNAEREVRKTMQRGIDRDPAPARVPLSKGWYGRTLRSMGYAR